MEIQLDICVAQRAILSCFKGALAPFRITPTQYSLLKCLWEEDEKTPSQLAKELHLDNATITGLLDRMERGGLVERVNNRENRRNVSVHLLKTGADLQEPVETLVLELNRQITEGIGPQEFDQLKDSLHKLTRNAGASDPDDR